MMRYHFAAASFSAAVARCAIFALVESHDVDFAAAKRG
jgi:hypothetical protein